MVCVHNLMLALHLSSFAQLKAWDSDTGFENWEFMNAIYVYKLTTCPPNTAP